MPKAGPKPSQQKVDIIRAIFRRVIRDNKVFSDLIEPKVQASSVKPADKARVKIAVGLFKTNTALRDAIRTELAEFNIKPTLKRARK